MADPARTARFVFALIVAFAFAAAAPAAHADSLAITTHSPSQEFSPNGDGQDDTLDIQYCLSGAAAVTTTVTREGSGTVTRTLESGRNRLPGCTSAGALLWDGTADGGGAAADGRYEIHVSATAGADSTDATWAVDVERRVPGTITSPKEGDLLSGTADIAFTPTPGFPHAIESFQAGAGAQMAYSAYCAGTQATEPASSGSWHSWFDTSKCPGAGRLSGLTVYSDAFGRRHNFTTGLLVEMDGPTTVARITRSVEFSPNGDGVEDSVRIAYCLSRDASVTTTITPEDAQSPVRTFEEDQPRSASCYATGDFDSAAFTWKGRDDAGTDMPDGRYTLHVHAVPTRGDTTPADIERTFVIQRLVPGRLTAPAALATIAGATDVAFTPTAGFPHPTASFSAFASGCAGSTATSAGGDGAWHSQLDAAACTAGPSVLRAVAMYTDDFDQQHLYPVPGVTVTVPPVVLTLQPNAARLFTGTQVRVTAKLAQGGAALAGRRVVLSVDSGPNAPRSRQATTSATGAAELAYYGSNPWTGAADDRVSACFDADANGTCGGGEPAAATPVHWVAARRMTVSLGTTLTADGAHRVRFVNDSVFCDTVSFKSHFDFTYARNDGSDAHAFVLTGLPTHRCSDDPLAVPGGVVTFDTLEGGGTGTLDGVAGYAISFRMLDAGEPGAAAGDRLEVTVKAPDGTVAFSFAAPISGGNVNAYQGELL